MHKIGDRVLAKWPIEAEWWYPGVVMATGPGTVEVQYFDGDRSTVQANEAIPLAIGTGSRVYCRWKGGGAYYPGTVTNAVGEAIYIDYDDGDKETTIVQLARVNEDDL
jgi:hypothetical protein